MVGVFQKVVVCHVLAIVPLYDRVRRVPVLPCSFVHVLKEKILILVFLECLCLASSCVAPWGSTNTFWVPFYHQTLLLY